MPSRCVFSATGQNRVSPSVPRTPMIESSRSNANELLGQLVLAHLLGRVDASLPLAVVAEPTGLHDRREARVLERAESCRRNPEPPEELLLDKPILPQLERARRRQSIDLRRSGDGDVLELVRDDVGSGGEALEGGGVVEGADDQLTDGGGRCGRRRIEEAEVDPER